MSNTPPNTRPFNLQDFLAGKPIVCRNGFVPQDIHYFKDAHNNHTPIFFGTNEGTVMRCDRNGVCPSDLVNNSDNKYDLFHPCEQKEGWVKLYRKNFGEVYVRHADVHNLEEQAKRFVKVPDDYLTTVKITWYE